MMLARKSRARMFSGHKGMGWKSWNDTTETAVKTLKSDQQSIMQSDEKPLIGTAPISSEEQISILLDSADDGAKLIVS